MNGKEDVGIFSLLSTPISSIIIVMFILDLCILGLASLIKAQKSQKVQNQPTLMDTDSTCCWGVHFCVFGHIGLTSS